MPLLGAVATLCALSCGWAVTSAAAETAATPPADIVSGTWQHHKVTLNHFGITSLYTCDGLEGQVRQILLHLGARKDLKVTARGCPGGLNAPSHSAWVDADFYTLAQVADTTAPDAVKARWTPVQVTPRHPFFMGDGDCELIQEMKDLITMNFTLRDMVYRADCIPRSITIDSFAVEGQSLRALPL